MAATATPATAMSRSRCSGMARNSLARARVMTAQQHAVVEDVLDPHLKISDPHHHLMDHAVWTDSAEDYLRDTTDGHRVTSTVFVEASLAYRESGPEHLREVGEIEFVRQVQLDTRNAPTWIGRGIVG